MERSITPQHPERHATPHTYSPEFYDALIAATSAALAAYPTDRGMLHRAVSLVLAGKVHCVAGTYTVESQTRPGRVYTPNGACQCEAYTHAEHGRCLHRWAVALYKRALHDSVPVHWLVTHSEALRDTRAEAGDEVAVICSPEHQQARALAGFAVTPDGRAGLAQRS